HRLRRGCGQRMVVTKVSKPLNAHELAIAQLWLVALARRIDFYKPYRWQTEFHEAGVDHTERMLMAANRGGKASNTAAELSYHLTGEYPHGWRGKTFNKPILAWTGSPTNETSRDIVQAELLGGLGEQLGSGLVPKHLIYGKPTARMAGVKNVVDVFHVKHA